MRSAGFTLIELMIVVVVIGILAAIALPNFISMQDRAREAGLKTNMHVFQLAAEDYAVQHDGRYSPTAGGVVSLVPGGNARFKNTFGGGIGTGVAWETRGALADPPSSVSGITSYADSAAHTYNVKGYGRATALPIILLAGS